MGIELCHISATFRYPIKSMAGESLNCARIGWHGVEGDRRLAFRRLADRGAFPWLTESRLPELLLYEPIGRQDTTVEPLPTHIRTPDGKEYGLTDEALLKEIATRHRADVELMHLSHGIFEEAGVSAITLGTIRSIAREVGHDADVRRFRSNLVIDTVRDEYRIMGTLHGCGLSTIRPSGCRIKRPHCLAVRPGGIGSRVISSTSYRPGGWLRTISHALSMVLGGYVSPVLVGRLKDATGRFAAGQIRLGLTMFLGGEIALNIRHYPAKGAIHKDSTRRENRSLNWSSSSPAVAASAARCCGSSKSARSRRIM